MSTTAVPARPSRGDELDLRIDSLAYGGAGVARLDGYVVFVRDAIPGDRVVSDLRARRAVELIAVRRSHCDVYTKTCP